MNERPSPNGKLNHRHAIRQDIVNETAFANPIRTNRVALAYRLSLSVHHGNSIPQSRVKVKFFLAVLHRPIVCVPVVIAHKAEHGILHVVRMVITTTIAAVSRAVRIDLDGLAASVDGGGRAVRLGFRGVHHVESITQVSVGVNIFFASIFSSDFLGLRSIDLVPSPHFFS